MPQKAAKSKQSPQHLLLGHRTARGSIDPSVVIIRAREGITRLKSISPQIASDVPDLKRLFSQDCRLYYTLAAISRRKNLDLVLRTKSLNLLYPLRSAIEHAILTSLPKVEDQKGLWRDATSKSFFGVSAKQGVSIRYGLSSCVPTKNCAGRCYGHDGRDRELHLIFRSVLNQFVGIQYCIGNEFRRAQILKDLSRAIDHAIGSSRLDSESANNREAFSRNPRIRFSHIGEMAHTPDFTNALAFEIKRRAPDINCVIYTRHPSASDLVPDFFVLNFTIEGDHDKRRKYAPLNSRLVNSSWDGILSSEAEVNFLEHHVEKSTIPVGNGKVCPVTVNHITTPSCDSAKCDLCFRDHPLGQA